VSGTRFDQLQGNVTDTELPPDAPIEVEVPAPRRQSVAVAALRSFFEMTKSLSLAVILFLIVRNFLVEAFKIPTGSMERTILVGDFLLVNKLVYGAEVPFTGKRLPALHEPRIGELLVFVYPVDPTKNFVKRLVGIAGDTLSMENGVLSRNGVRQHERYVTHSDPDVDPAAEEFHWQRDFLVRHISAAVSYHPSRNNWGPIVVPAKHYFVLGDNRDNSLDSRYWGFVADSLVRGQPMVVYYSYTPDSSTAFDWLTRVRWRRLGETVH
jgi:signal peptidase I